MKMEQKDTLEWMRQMVSQRAWVRTPWKYTKLGGGLSLIQQQALLMVSEHLQGYIRNFYDLHLDKAKERPKSLFTEYMLHEGIPPFRIYLQDLGVQPSHYDDARKAIDGINLQVEHQEYDANGRPTGRTIRTNVFSQFGFEDTGDWYRFTNKQGEQRAVERKQPYIDVKINTDVAMWAFDMNDGYVNHLKMIAMYATKRPTPRIYLLLMRALRKEQQTATLRMPLTELKEYLGIRPYFDEKKKKTIVPYPMFSNFKQKVLDAVQEDLQRMASLNPQTTDITFTYELCYPGSRKKGDPEAILFHIERTTLGMAYNIVVNHIKPKRPIVAVEQDLFANQTTEAVLTKEQAQQAWGKCFADLKTTLGLSGADVWLLYYEENTQTVCFSYDAKSQQITNLISGGTNNAIFFNIVKKHFGQKVVIKFRKCE